MDILKLAENFEELSEEKPSLEDLSIFNSPLNLYKDRSGKFFVFEGHDSDYNEIFTAISNDEVKALLLNELNYAQESLKRHKELYKSKSLNPSLYDKIPYDEISEDIEYDNWYIRTLREKIDSIN